MTKSKDQEIWILAAFGERHIRKDPLKRRKPAPPQFRSLCLARDACHERDVSVSCLLLRVFKKRKNIRPDEEITTLSRSGKRNKKLNQAQSSPKKRRREGWLALIPACSRVCCVTRTVISRACMHLYARLSRGSRHPNRIERRGPTDASRRWIALGAFVPLVSVQCKEIRCVGEMTYLNVFRISI